MMYEENARKVNTVIESLGGRARMKVIPIGVFDSLIRAKDRLEHGEWVGILGDRVVDSDRLIHVPFLGRTAAFPAGPFLMASALKVPVVLFACLHLGGNRYKEHFELFAEELTLDRHQRDAALERWVRRYAERLEYYCRLAPYNWFNFYDFWRTAEAGALREPDTTLGMIHPAVESKSLHP
jgi:predicted LPLAT superfamily acyltransferase